MQINSLYKKGNAFLKILLIVVAFGFLVQQFFIKKDIVEHLHHLFHSFTSDVFITFFVLAIGLMPINWLFEALKWRFLIGKNEQISIGTSIKAVLAGISLSSITPNRVGEFFARLFVLKKTRFWEGVFITIIGSFSQTILTLSFGLISIFVFWVKCPNCFYWFSENPLYLVIFGVLVLMSLIFLNVVYFKISWFRKFIPTKWKRIRIYSLILQKYTSLELFKVLIFSFIRYCIFSFQFVLLLWSLGVEIPFFQAMLLVSIIFFVNTINPSIALLELGVRGSISIFVIKIYFEIFQKTTFDAEMEVLISSSFIWLINIVLPALMGLFFIKDLNFFGFRNEQNDN
jgi:uncharacterized membrane protein YbhN (UPF0104 family)